MLTGYQSLSQGLIGEETRQSSATAMNANATKGNTHHTMGPVVKPAEFHRYFSSIFATELAEMKSRDRYHGYPSPRRVHDTSIHKY